jgi:hypothetical protein
MSATRDRLVRRVMVERDERAVREKLYGGPRSIEVGPQSPPLNDARPATGGKPGGTRDEPEQVFVDVDSTG